MEASRLTDQGLPSTARKRSFFTMPIMSSPMSSAMLMFRNSASQRQSPDHIQIERQFSCPLRALVLKSDRDARGAGLKHLQPVLLRLRGWAGSVVPTVSFDEIVVLSVATAHFHCGQSGHA